MQYENYQNVSSFCLNYIKFGLSCAKILFNVFQTEFTEIIPVWNEFFRLFSYEFHMKGERCQQSPVCTVYTHTDRRLNQATQMKTLHLGLWACKICLSSS